MKESGKWIYKRLQNSSTPIVSKKGNLWERYKKINFKVINDAVVFTEPFKKTATLEIYNMAGRRVILKRFTGDRVLLNSLGHGVHLIRVILDGKTTDNLLILKKTPF